MESSQPKARLTILCPVYNEQNVVPLFFGRLRTVAEVLKSTYDVHLLFLNNCSTDGTLNEIQKIRAEHSWVYVITLSRNEGYQRSLECGLRAAQGDLFAFIDVDCEDPPEMLIDFVAKYEAGYDIVYGDRADREESEVIQLSRKLFYRITRLIADDEIVLDMAEFSLLSSEVRDAVVEDRSSFPFIRASIGRVGFRRIGIPYKRHKRIAGDTHYNLLGMTKFAVTGILSSTTLFLRIPLYTLPVYLLLSALCVLRLFSHPSSAVLGALIWLSGAYVGTTLAFLCLYVARTYKNTLARPNAVINARYSAMQPHLSRVTKRDPQALAEHAQMQSAANL